MSASACATARIARARPPSLHPRDCSRMLRSFQGGTPTVLTCAPAILAPGQVATCNSYDHVITEAEVHSDEGLLVNTVLAEGDAGLVSGTIQVTASAAAEAR